jgi:hypothetical protein
MADPGSLLKFPGGKPEKALPFTSKGGSLPTLDTYEYDETVNLYQIATSVKKKAEDLIQFVDQNRAVARQAGIELLTVQLTSILEGDKFQRVVDALEDAVYRRVPIALTQDGIDKVHRMERLIADADSFIVNFMNGKKIEPMLGQAPTPSGSTYPSFSPYPVYAPHQSSDLGTWMPVLIIGIAGIVGVIAIIALSNNRPREAAGVSGPAPAPAPTPAPAPAPMVGRKSVKSRKS